MMKNILILLLMLAAGSAQANISIFPYCLDFEAESNKRVQSVRVINTSNETKTYRVSFVNFKQDADGKLSEISKDDNTFAVTYLNWSPRQFTLKPNEVQTVNVARKSMAQAPDGEFVSHLKIGEVNLGAPKLKQEKAQNGTLSMTLKALFAVTLPVTISKGKDLYCKTDITSYKRLDNGDLEVVLKRSGNKSSRVNVAVIDDNGHDIGRVNNIKIYLSTDTLKVAVPLDEKLVSNNAQLKLEDARTKKDILTQAISL